MPVGWMQELRMRRRCGGGGKEFLLRYAGWLARERDLTALFAPHPNVPLTRAISMKARPVRVLASARISASLP